MVRRSLQTLAVAYIPADCELKDGVRSAQFVLVVGTYKSIACGHSRVLAFIAQRIRGVS